MKKNSGGLKSGSAGDMTFSKNFVLEKLTEIEQYQSELKQLLQLSDEKILNDSGRMHSAERLLQLIVNLILDVNQHLIKELNLEVVEDFQSTFYALGKGNVLPADFAEKITPVVGTAGFEPTTYRV